MQIQIGKLPRGIREDLFNVHATFTDNDANENAFYRKRVPVKTINLDAIDNDILYDHMDEENINEYANAIAKDGMLEFGTVADGRLYDGLHRITTRKAKDMNTMYVIDMTGLINTEKYAAGSICDVEFTENPVELFKAKQQEQELNL